MIPPILNIMLQQSIPFKLHRRCLRVLKQVLDHSQFLKVQKKIWISIEIIIHHSSFIRYFHQSHCFLDQFFQHSLLMDGFKQLFFKLAEFFTTIFQEAFTNSFFQNKGQNISKDISRYSIRPFAFVFFAYFSIGSTMRMAFGQGLNRSEVMFVFIILVFLWFLAHTRIPLSYFSKKSVLLAFLKDLVS